MKLLIAIIVLSFISCNSTKKIAHKEEIKTSVVDKSVKDSIQVKIIDSVVSSKSVDTINELNFVFSQDLPLWVKQGELVDSGQGVRVNVPKGTQLSVVKKNAVHEVKTILFKSDSTATNQHNNIITNTDEVKKDTDKKASRFAWTSIIIGICLIVLLLVGYRIYKQVKI